MNSKEHMLLITMLTIQRMHLMALVKLLRNHNLCTEDELRWYVDFERFDRGVAPVDYQQMGEVYAQVATTLGLDVQITDADIQP